MSITAIAAQSAMRTIFTLRRSTFLTAAAKNKKNNMNSGFAT